MSRNPGTLLHQHTEHRLKKQNLSHGGGILTRRDSSEEEGWAGLRHWLPIGQCSAAAAWLRRQGVLSPAQHVDILHFYLVVYLTRVSQKIYKDFIFK
jgi:hypothetical protein